MGLETRSICGCVQVHIVHWLMCCSWLLCSAFHVGITAYRNKEGVLNVATAGGTAFFVEMTCECLL